MGLSATFTVQAVGQNLQYQWSRNGISIPGANASTYVSAITAFSDNGATFAVVVSNSAGSVTSNPADLTITARAPIAGDLRFQQVDAASTVNGYSVLNGGAIDTAFCPLFGGGGSAVQYSQAIGTSFFLENQACAWQISVFGLPTGVTGLETGIVSAPINQYQAILSNSYLTLNPSPVDRGSVINSLRLAATNYSVGLVYNHSDTATGFVRTAYTVPASSLQSAATQEGLLGHVVTAISYDGTDATFFSYGWTGDPTTIYETQVVFTTDTAATQAAQTLAQQGYIITATGSSEETDGSGWVLIGTRVQGDTMPRPMLVGSILDGTIDPLLQQGYAIVGVVNQYQGATLVVKNYIGER
jgi:hypothetical protein